MFHKNIPNTLLTPENTPFLDKLADLLKDRQFQPEHKRVLIVGEGDIDRVKENLSCIGYCLANVSESHASAALHSDVAYHAVYCMQEPQCSYLRCTLHTIGRPVLYHNGITPAAMLLDITEKLRESDYEHQRKL
jgi:hypothetical protein